MEVGLTLGKFLPFHKGHELLIQIASQNSDLLIILVGTSEDDPWSFETRKVWIQECLDNIGRIRKAIVLEQPELDKNAPKDSNGTITDEDYWNKWLENTKTLLNPNNLRQPLVVTRVFTSDLYGERIAKELDAIWIPVDPNREIIPISGTKVRNNFSSEFKDLPWYVKQSMTKAVAVVGPESTGKSTLSKHLGQVFKSPYVPEYGRTLALARNNDLSEKDFDLIFGIQNQLIKNAIGRAYETPLVVTDTENIVTAVWFKKFFNELPNKKFPSLINHYIVMSPTVPFVQDGTRITTEIERWSMFYDILEIIRSEKLNHTIITDSRWVVRTALAEECVREVLKT